MIIEFFICSCRCTKNGILCITGIFSLFFSYTKDTYATTLSCRLHDITFTMHTVHTKTTEPGVVDLPQAQLR